MSYAIPLDALSAKDRAIAGPGAWALVALGQKGFSVPRSLCITTQAYDEYVEKTGLRERILMELNRKNPHDILWEEIWDACLRIRGMFLNIPMPPGLSSSLKAAIDGYFGEKALAIRTSSAREDPFATGAALPGGFPAGITGGYAALDHIRLEWASACADCKSLALRGVGAERPSVAVMVQEMPLGGVRGRAFRTSPGCGDRVIIVCDTTQGRADCPGGPVQWVLEGGTGRALSRFGPHEGSALSEEGELEVSEQVLAVLSVIGPEWEVEWVFIGGAFHILHARPWNGGPCFPRECSSGHAAACSGDIRQLQGVVERSFIPGAAAEADSFSSRQLGTLAGGELAVEVGRRGEAVRKWSGLYRDMVVPLAYAMVVFGTLYNEAVRPVDPYEFADLLMLPEIPALRKDNLLEKMALLARCDRKLLGAIRRHAVPVGSAGFMGLFKEYLEGLEGAFSMAKEGRGVLDLVLRLAEKSPGRHGRRHLGIEKLTEDFLASLPREMRQPAMEALGLAREACRLQSEAASQVMRIERAEDLALVEHRRRLASPGQGAGAGEGMPDCQCQAGTMMKLFARQLAGRSLSSGRARGQARVVRGENDLSRFRAGEIMVCDSLDPHMAALIPLAEAVVVERAAMLREGMAIARKYGLPYVAGVSEATRFIRTGDRVTVDGHLGLVIIEQRAIDASGGALPWSSRGTRPVS